MSELVYVSLIFCIHRACPSVTLLINKFSIAITVWKAFDTGPGKKIPWEELNPDALGYEGKFVSSDLQGQAAGDSISVPWVPITQNLSSDRMGQPTENEVEEDETTDMGPGSAEMDGNWLFCCSESGCTASFIREGNLARHVISEKHKFETEKDSLPDFAIKTYQKKVSSSVFEAAAAVFSTAEHSCTMHSWYCVQQQCVQQHNAFLVGIILDAL